MKKISPVWLLAIVLILLNQSEDLKAAAPSNDFRTDGPNSSDIFLLNYRLPNETYPVHYNINIKTDVHLGKTVFQGEVTIDIVVNTSTCNIVLHAGGLEISKVSAVNPGTETEEELSHEYELVREFLTLKRRSGESFRTATKWQLTIVYNGRIRDDLKGLHLLNYTDANGNVRYIASTQFEKTYARHVFPCYDEPAKRANFTITIHHSPNFQAISNMPVNDIYSSAGKTVFLTTAKIPTYIVAFVVGEFEYSEVNFDGIRQRVYSRPSRKRDHQFALDCARLFLKYFSEYFGIGYMISKFDLLAVTQHQSGGMENWGLVTLPEKYLLYNTNSSLSQLQTSIATYIAHEVCHQWVGDLVTIQWWSNNWLKEGFADLFAYHAMEKVYPKWNIWEYFHVFQFQQALVTDAMWNSVPLTVYVETPSDVQSTYNTLSYYKGSSVLLMWQKALGEEVFRSAVQNLLKIYRYSAVTEDDLYVELQKSAEIHNMKLPASISKMMKTWTQQGGYPILTVSRNYSEGSFTIKQEVYTDNATLKDNKTWYIPINFAVASNPDFNDTKASHYLANQNEFKVHAQLANDDWIILNKRSEYFYRIKYDEENYKFITQTLVENPFTIHLRNRAQLLSDAFYLTITNRLDHGVLLEMLTYLTKEEHFVSWQTAFSIFHYYSKLFHIQEFKNFLGDLVKPMFEKLGVHEIPGENHFAQYTRDFIIVLAYRAKLRECLVQTNRKLKAHLMQNATIEPELILYTFSYGLTLADDYEFDIIYQRLMQSPDISERKSFITYLGFSQNEKHINKLISSSIDMSNKLLADERYSLLASVTNKGERSLLLCIEFLSQNWDAYAKIGSNGHNPLDADIRNMAEFVRSKEAERKFLALVTKVKDSKYVSKNLEAEVRSQINENSQWFKEHGQPVISWLSRHYPTTVREF